MNVELKVLDPRLGTTWPLPTYATDGSAALDLRAMLVAAFYLYPGESRAFHTGFALHIADPGLCALILPRSGLGVQGLVLANLVGLIDSDYQGEIVVNAWNRADDPIRIEPGDRIAQLLFAPVARPVFDIVDDFAATTTRGVGGFGSTGA